MKADNDISTKAKQNACAANDPRDGQIEQLTADLKKANCDLENYKDMWFKAVNVNNELKKALAALSQVIAMA